MADEQQGLAGLAGLFGGGGESAAGGAAGAAAGGMGMDPVTAVANAATSMFGMQTAAINFVGDRLKAKEDKKKARAEAVTNSFTFKKFYDINDVFKPQSTTPYIIGGVVIIVALIFLVAMKSRKQ